MQNFTLDPLTHLIFGATYFAFASDDQLQFIDLTFPSDLWQKLKYFFNNLPSRAITPEVSIHDFSSDFSFLTAENNETSDFELKWEKYLQPLQNSYEYEDFEASPRSSTPIPHISHIDLSENNNSFKVDIINY